MDITVDSSSLHTVCVNASKTTPTKSSLPITACLLIEITTDSLLVTTTDMENWSLYTLPADISFQDNESKTFCIEKTALLSMLRELPSQPVNISINNNTATIRYANGYAKLPILDAKDFPKPQAISTEKTLSLSAQMLLGIIEKAMYAISEDILRPVLNGIYFDFTGQELVTVSTDCHSLCRYTHPGIEWERSAFIMSKRCAILVQAMLENHLKQFKKNDSQVLMSFDKKNIKIVAGNDYIISRIIEGKFPNYNLVIPQKALYKLEVNRQALINAIRRTVVFANKESPLLDLEISYGKLIIKTQDICFSTSSEEKVTCRWTGGANFHIGFKGTFLRNTLENIMEEEVTIDLTDESHAGIFKGINSKDDILMLLMPMKLNTSSN